MGRIDYRIPFHYIALSVRDVPNGQGGFTPRVLETKISNQWKNIYLVEEFVCHWMFPNDDRPKSNIVLYGGPVHTVPVAFEDLAQKWEDYKIWESNKEYMLFRKPN